MCHQLYSGNLEAYKWAVKHLTNAGVEVVVSPEHYDPKTVTYNVSIELYEPRGSSKALLAVRTFWHGDVDVLYNTLTQWLNRQAESYCSWE